MQSHPAEPHDLLLLSMILPPFHAQYFFAVQLYGIQHKPPETYAETYFFYLLRSSQVVPSVVLTLCASKGVFSVAHLLWHLPTGIVDRRKTSYVKDLVEGEVATVLLKVSMLVMCAWCAALSHIPLFIGFSPLRGRETHAFCHHPKHALVLQTPFRQNCNCTCDTLASLVATSVWLSRFLREGDLFPYRSSRCFQLWFLLRFQHCYFFHVDVRASVCNAAVDAGIVVPANRRHIVTASKITDALDELCMHSPAAFHGACLVRVECRICFSRAARFPSDILPPSMSPDALRSLPGSTNI